MCFVFVLCFVLFFCLFVWLFVCLVGLFCFVLVWFGLVSFCVGLVSFCFGLFCFVLFCFVLFVCLFVGWVASFGKATAKTSNMKEQFSFQDKNRKKVSPQKMHTSLQA